MSIKTIDSQIMIARTADFAKDASATQKRPEIAQDYQARKEKINDALDQTRVVKSDDSQKSEFHPDEGGGGGFGYGGGPDSDDGENSGESDANFLVPPGDSMIDIWV